MDIKTAFGFGSLEDAEVADAKDVILEASKSDISRSRLVGINAYILGKDPVVLMYPSNDGRPTCPHEWYRRSIVNEFYTRVISNREDFTEISNLGEIINKTADVMIESYEKEEPVFAYSDFGILLVDKLRPDYKGEGDFVMILGGGAEERADKEKLTSDFCNNYLDMFIGYNYGDFVLADKKLEEKLLGFSKMMIKDGVRTEHYKQGREIHTRKSNIAETSHYKFPPE
jgi:hypothetical protein